jgi:hypothetical protein
MESLLKISTLVLAPGRREKVNDVPAESKSQHRAIWAKEGRGEISSSKAHEMTHGDKYNRLPERKKRAKRALRKTGRR